MADDFFGVNLGFEDFDKLLNNDDLEEEPVSLEVFVRDQQFLGLKRDLSDIQLEIARHITQVYKLPTLIQLYGEEKATEWYNKYTVSEVIAEAGKGSGKDFVTRISFCYIVYLLHCLRDPLDYYNKAYGTYIDILNLAVNAQQAQNVFFDPFKNLLLGSPYFNEVGFEPRVGQVLFFSRPIRCFSGHSESEGWEGYDLLMVVLDEISAFKMDSELHGEARNKGSASAIYQMSKASVMSRFPEVGKVVLLSFPRFKDDFIEERYKAFLKGNEPKTWGIKASTWEMNPTISREDLEPEFQRNPVQANSRFACEPPEMEDAYFREPDLVRKAFVYGENPLEENGTYKAWFNGADGNTRFIHVDLGLKRDQAALAMVHSSGLKEVKTLSGIETLPIVYVDFLQHWRGNENQEVPFAAIRQQIVDLARKFDVGLVTFDTWQSVDMIQSLRAAGINSEWHTVAKTDYDTLSTTIYDERLRGYWNEELVEGELLKLKLINNKKIDHPSKGEKDKSDAIAGAVFQCLLNFQDGEQVDIEIFGMGRDYDEDEQDVFEKIIPQKEDKSQEMPDDLETWLFETL
jgi:hypothetical protein